MLIMEEAKVSNLCRGAYGVFSSVGMLLFELLRSAGSFLASTTNTTGTSGRSDVAPSGGVLNFRTAQLDDGTDPVGWYEKD